MENLIFRDFDFHASSNVTCCSGASSLRYGEARGNNRISIVCSFQEPPCELNQTAAEKAHRISRPADMSTVDGPDESKHFRCSNMGLVPGGQMAEWSQFIFLSRSGSSVALMILQKQCPLGSRRLNRSRLARIGTCEVVQGHLCSILLRVVQVLPVVPEPGRERAPVNGHSARPSRAPSYVRVRTA